MKKISSDYIKNNQMLKNIKMPKNPLFQGKRKFFWIGLAAVILIILIIVIAKNLPSGSKNKSDTQEGIDYIKALEATPTDEVEAYARQMRKEAKMKALQEDNVDIWSMFTDIALMGDSRTIGFSVFGFLEERRVLAEGGATIRDIPNYLDALKAVNPSYVVLSYGLNDISIGYWETVEEYITELDQRLEEIHQAVPQAVVFVTSTIPAQQMAFSRAPVWANIPEWNQAIAAHCKEKNIPYIDINPTVEAHSDLYNPDDGIHMQKEFYPYWAVDILTEVSEYE